MRVELVGQYGIRWGVAQHLRCNVLLSTPCLPLKGMEPFPRPFVSKALFLHLSGLLLSQSQL